MRKMIMQGVVLALTICVAVPALAILGWAGNAFPNDGHTYSGSGDQLVFAQVWKDGFTNGAGQGADISAVLRYQTDLMGSPTDLAMAYITDIGNNDEYAASIPEADLVGGASYVDVTIIFTDETDGTTEIANDQAGNAPPLRYTTPTTTLGEDKIVCLQVCMQGVENTGDVCISGSLPEMTEWGEGIKMFRVWPDLHQECFTFEAGMLVPLTVEYKFRKDGCETWESLPNRVLTINAGMPAEQTITHSFDDTPAICVPVGTEQTTWGILKSTYR